LNDIYFACGPSKTAFLCERNEVLKMPKLHKAPPIYLNAGQLMLECFVLHVNIGNLNIGNLRLSLQAALLLAARSQSSYMERH
jgi:hypothetical protein